MVDRYRTDFEELSVLGKGGFGFVTKCRSRLSGDGIYAIKCIPMNPQNESLDFMLREASNLARLHHKNVVRYFTAWIEVDNSPLPAAPAAAESSGRSLRQTTSAEWTIGSPCSSKLSDTVRERLISQLRNVDSFWQKAPLVQGNATDESSDSVGFVDDGSSDEIAFASSPDHSSPRPGALAEEPPPLKRTSPGTVLLPGDLRQRGSDPKSYFAVSPYQCPGVSHARDRNSIQFSSSAMVSQGNTCSTTEADQGKQLEAARSASSASVSALNSHSKLYIVMEYVEGCTLRKLILERLCDDPNLAWDLFSQILEGLAYMHRSKLLHRDVKPENIFLKQSTAAGETYQVKIGDLGLSKSLETSLLTSPTPQRKALQADLSLSTGVGTYFYIAPEVEAGARYDQAADIYALGVVLYEMFHPPFETTMERYKELNELQSTLVVHGVADAKAAHLITLMLSPEPAERPSAASLLEQCSAGSKNWTPVIDKVLKYPYSYEMLKLLGCVFNRSDARYSKQEARKSIVRSLAVENQEAQRMRAYVHRVMRCFNALYYDAPILVPSSERSLLGWFERSKKYIDTSGSPLKLLPASLACVVKATSVAVQNATVVRRYTLGFVCGSTGDVTIMTDRRMHMAFDVVCDMEKLTHADKRPEDPVVVESRELMLEFEPLAACAQVLAPLASITEEVKMLCAYGRLVPLVVHFLTGLSSDLALAVVQTLSRQGEDMREAALLLKESHENEFGGQYLYSEAERKVRVIEGLMRYEGPPGALLKRCKELVENLLPSGNLDPAADELTKLMEKLRRWEQRLALPDTAKIDELQHSLRFRSYIPYNKAYVRSSTSGDFTFVVLSGSHSVAAVCPHLGKQVCGFESPYSELPIVAIGGAISAGSLMTHWLEMDLQLLIDAGRVVGLKGLSQKKKERKLLLKTKRSRLQASVVGGTAVPADHAFWLPVGTALDSKQLVGELCPELVSHNWKRYTDSVTMPPTVFVAPTWTPEMLKVLIVVASTALHRQAYQLKVRLAGARIQATVAESGESELARAKRCDSGSHSWLVYIASRKDAKTAYRLTPLPQIYAVLSDPRHQAAAALTPQVEANDRWFDAPQTLFNALFSLSMLINSALAPAAAEPF